MKESKNNIICFIILGWASNFGYHLMLSSAKKMMNGRAPTTTVLLCDIAPTFVIKLVYPFIFEKIKLNLKVYTIVLASVLGFVFGGFSKESIGCGLTGVILQSVAHGLGEVAFLNYSSQFATSTVGAWSCGTGISSISSAAIYAILSDVLNVSQKSILYSFIPIPVLVMEGFLFADPNDSPGQVRETISKQISDGPSEPGFRQKFKSLKFVWQPVLSVLLIYVSEYLKNQSVNPIIQFSTHGERYYTFAMFAYQTGQFLSRSSLPLFKLPRWSILIPSALQFAYLVFGCFQAVKMVMDNVWAMLAFDFVEGILGGLIYANGMYYISILSLPEFKKFCLSIGTLSSSASILSAGLLGMWLEPFLKKQQHKI